MPSVETSILLLQDLAKLIMNRLEIYCKLSFELELECTFTGTSVLLISSHLFTAAPFPPYYCQGLDTSSIVRYTGRLGDIRPSLPVYRAKVRKLRRAVISTKDKVLSVCRRVGPSTQAQSASTAVVSCSSTWTEPSNLHRQQNEQTERAKETQLLCASTPV